MRIWYLICCFCIGFPTLAQSELPTLLQYQYLRGSFEQQRQLQALALPLYSSGEFQYDAGQGLLWQILKPFTSRIEINRDGRVLVGADTENMQQVPTSQLLAEIFLAVFAGDVTALEGLFEMQWHTSVDEDIWYLNLTPSNQAMAQFIESVKLQGKQTLQSIKLVEATGDITTIELQIIETR